MYAPAEELHELVTPFAHLVQDLALLFRASTRPPELTLPPDPILPVTTPRIHLLLTTPGAAHALGSTAVSCFALELLVPVLDCCHVRFAQVMASLARLFQTSTRTLEEVFALALITGAFRIVLDEPPVPAVLAPDVATPANIRVIPRSGANLARLQFLVPVVRILDIFTHDIFPALVDAACVLLGAFSTGPYL